MLHVSEETYQKTLEEQEEYERLAVVGRRAQLGRRLVLRSWLSGVATVLLVVAGLNPRYRLLLVAAAALLPFLAWQLYCLATREKYLGRVIAAESAERRLAVLEDRQGIRRNLIEQKQAQDEIERLRQDIDEMKKTGEPK
jgi:Mn2+/Fe2+ NRAMP family transporter